MIWCKLQGSGLNAPQLSCPARRYASAYPALSRRSRDLPCQPVPSSTCPPLQPSAVCWTSPTGTPGKAANFLLAWWNAKSCGGWDLAELWAVDHAVADDMLLVACLIADSHAYPNFLDLQEDSVI